MARPEINSIPFPRRTLIKGIFVGAGLFTAERADSIADSYQPSAGTIYDVAKFTAHALRVAGAWIIISSYIDLNHRFNKYQMEMAQNMRDMEKNHQEEIDKLNNKNINRTVFIEDQVRKHRHKGTGGTTYFESDLEIPAIEANSAPKDDS